MMIRRDALRAWMADPRTMPNGVALYRLEPEGHELAGKALRASHRGCLERRVLAGVRAEQFQSNPHRSAAVAARSDELATDTLEVRIEDRGAGEPSEMLERISVPYTRLAPAGDDRTGTGLGLAIARRLFAAHGGDIRAEPAKPCGRRVRMTLPRAC